jgi:diguanylate cyclase
MNLTSSLPYFIQHDPRLVALSVVMACLGGYVGLGLAAQVQAASGMRRRGLLAGAAWSVGLGIWTMHFVGMLAAKMPAGVLYSILPTLLSFLMCVLVVGIGIFLASAGKAGKTRIALAGLFMGAGIVTMHYLGIGALSGPFTLHHDHWLMALAALIAVLTSSSALFLFVADHRPLPLALSAILFGLAVSGMHYTAMAGMHLVPGGNAASPFGPAVTGEDLAIVVAILGFVISGGFLLFLVPDAAKSARLDFVSGQTGMPASAGTIAGTIAEPLDIVTADMRDAPPETVPLANVPVESDGMKKLIPVNAIRSIQANAHYTLIFDGHREHLSTWSITEAERRLDTHRFMRVHRSFLVSVDHVRALRKAGDGGMIEVEGTDTRTIPVSRAHYAELKSRLGLAFRSRMTVPLHQ